jgi:HK97 family phage portal protein
MPWEFEVYRVNNRNVYRCTILESTLASGGSTYRIEWHDQDDIIHIPGLGFNGIRGTSRIRSFARNAVSLALLLEEQTGRVHENAARPSGLVTIPPSTASAPDNFKRFKAQFDENHVGRFNAGRVVFGDKDSTYTPFQMSQEDLNTLAFRSHQVADISRFFGVPLHLLNETEKSTSWGTGLSEQTLGFLIYTLEPDLARIEAELNYKLFYGSDYYVEFTRDALMAMDPLKAAQVAQAEIGTGTLLINEYRRHKNRPPVENGNEPMINSTNIPLKKIFEPGAQPRQDPIQDQPIPAKTDVGAPTADGDGSGA